MRHAGALVMTTYDSRDGEKCVLAAEDACPVL